MNSPSNVSLNKEQGEEEETTKAVKELRKALSAEPTLNSRVDKAFLLKFLRARKFNQERALELVKNYYKQRVKYPDLYQDLQFSAHPNLIKSRKVIRLPVKDHLSRTVVVANKVGLWEPSIVPAQEVLQYVLLNLELLLDDPETQEKGLVFVLDASGFSFRHLRALNPYIIARLISITWNSFPAKFKEVHAIKVPYYFKIFYAMAKPFLTEKLKSRIHLYGSEFDQLHDHVPREMLPEGFGGVLGPFDNSEWHRMLLDNDPVIRKNSFYGYIVD